MFMINFVEYVVKLKVLITFSFSLSTAQMKTQISQTVLAQANEAIN